MTLEAIKNLKGVKERDSKAEKIIESAGGKLLSHYYTFGRYDFIAVVELPSTEALAEVLIEIEAWGTVSIETMTALHPGQIHKIASET